METSGFPMTHHGVHHLRSLSLSAARHCGGGGEIRTLEGRKPLLVFKTSAFNRSATPPFVGITMFFMYLGCIRFVVFTTLFTNTVSVSH